MDNHGAPPSQSPQHVPSLDQARHSMSARVDWHGAPPSQYGLSPGNSLHAPDLTQSGQFLQSRPLPTLPPLPNNATYHTPQYMPAAPQPLHPMAGYYTPGISASSPFLQPVSRSAYSAQSVYGTPQEHLSQSGTPHLYTPAQTHQQDFEMEDHIPRHMPGRYEPTEHSQDRMSQWVAGQRSKYQQTSGMVQNAHPYGVQTPTQLYGAQPTPTQQSHSTQYNQLQWLLATTITQAFDRRLKNFLSLGRRPA